MRTLMGEAGYRSEGFVFRSFPATGVVRTIVNAQHWSMLSERDVSVVPTRHTTRWRVAGDLFIDSVDDVEIETTYAMLTRQSSAAGIDNASQILRAHPEVMSVDELLERIRTAETTDDLELALVRVGLAAPYEVDERIVDQLRSHVRSGSRDVQEGAIFGMSYTEWPLFRTDLLEVANNTDDKFIRDLIADHIDIFKAEGGDR